MKKVKKENKKILKKGIALALAGTMIGTVFVGCSKQKTLLEDTILDDTEVVYVDEQPLIMRFYYPKFNNCNGKHYQDIISSKVYHVENENKEGTKICFYKDIITLNSDTKREPITPYLTADELKKAKDNNFTDADVIEIEQRITNQAKTLN